MNAGGQGMNCDIDFTPLKLSGHSHID